MVTGGAGFIGSHLVQRLVAEDDEVLVLDDLSTGVEANVAPGATLERLDISGPRVARRVRAWRPAIVYHLAAQASVVRSGLDPLRDLRVNVMGTQRVAAAARACGARRLVFVSSGGAIYGESARAATERTPPAPTSHYGVHKLAAEGHVRLAGLSHAILRPSNVYGPRQASGLEGAVVAVFIAQALMHGALEIHGDGRQTRDFVHVRDVVEALLALGRPSSGDGTWNVASGRSVQITTLADLVERAVARPLVRSFAPPRPGDVKVSAMSPTALRRLGWRPTVRLEAGLTDLVRAARAGA